MQIATPVLAASDPDGALALIELGSLLLVLGGLARLSHHLRMSPVPLYLMAGVLLGLGPGPIELADDTLELSAAIGVVMLLFFIGLEYTGGELLQTLREQRISGLVDFALNAIPGFAVGLAMGLGWKATAALAGITWISSSGVISRTLDDLGRLGNRETPSILSILVMEDLAMAVYLPILTVALIGGTFAAALGSLAIALLVLVVVLALALRGSEHASRVLTTERVEALALSVLGVTLLVAGLAEAVNVSSAVGAFLVGIALSGTVADQARTALAPIRDVFAAGFFVVFGMQIDLTGLPSVLAWIAILVVAGAAGKLMTGWDAARRSGVGIPGRVRAGTVLIARGEFSIVIASLAVAAGVDERLGPLAAGYVLIAALLASLLTRFSGPIAARLPSTGQA